MIDPPPTKRSIVSLRKRRTDPCPRCGRITCNCPIIDEMARRGWRVYHDKRTYLWRIVEPDGSVYKVGYADRSLAWNFAVRQFIESLPTERND